MENNKIKLSQYADDTQLILDGTEKSLKAALNLFKQFYTTSGLKINVDKTSTLWIGSSCGSLETLCEKFALDRSQDPLKF